MTGTRVSQSGDAIANSLRSCVIASVGGQGGLLATRVLADVFLRAGSQVKTSEVHGMAQRGGSVMSFVRRGSGVFSPMVEPGAADALLGLELLEAARALAFLKPGGIIVSSTEQVLPMPVVTGQARMPVDLEQRLQGAGGRIVLLPAAEIAAGLGAQRSSNVVCLGALAAVSGIDRALWLDAVTAAVPPRTIEVNLAAFAAGAAYAERGAGRA